MKVYDLANDLANEIKQSEEYIHIEQPKML